MSEGLSDACLVELQKTVASKSVDNWFQQAEWRRVAPGLVEVATDSLIARDWIRAHYLPQCEEAAGRVLAEPVRVRAVLRTDAVSPIEDPKPSTRVEETVDDEHVYRFQKEYTFDNFILGSGNRFAAHAAQGVVLQPIHGQFNPVFLHGSVGLGKTHLLHAIGNELAQTRSDLRIIGVTAERYMSDFIQSIRDNATSHFKSHYRKADVLLVDDVQFLFRGEKTQEEFFHTFNALHQDGKQIVMTCDLAPEHLEGVQDRLASRFKWGLVVSIDAPDIDTRIQILHKKAKQAGIRLPNDVAVLLGNYVQSNVRELEGLLRHLIARASMYGRDITVDDAKDALQLRGLAHRGAGQNILDVQSVVADKLGVSVDELKGKSRKREVARARQIAMFLSREVTGDSLAVVGAHFGKRDHSTVVHAIQTIQTLASTDPNIEKLLKELRTEFKR